MARISYIKPKMKGNTLVLGSGGIKACAAIGLLKVLEEKKIEIDHVFASSAGSIIGALYAMGRSAHDIQDLVLKFWKNKLFLDLNLTGIINLFSTNKKGDLPFALIKGRRIEQTLYDNFGDIDIETTQRCGLTITATNVKTGKSELLEKGSLVKALMASISLPIFMPPQVFRENLLVDGGLSNPLPLDIAINRKYSAIIAMGFDSFFEEPAVNPLSYLINLINRVIKDHFEAKIGECTKNAEKDGSCSEIIRIPVKNKILFFNTKKINELITAGEKEAEARIIKAYPLSEHYSTLTIKSMTPYQT